MTNEKQDLRQHSDSELSLIVFNDEGLYNMRRNKTALLETLNDLFLYNSDQLAELEQDLEDDANEG
jgi:hypothetical protein